MNKDNRNYQINRMKHQLDQKPITKVDRFKMKKVKKVWVFACAVTTIFGVNAIMEMVPETQTIESVASSNKNESTVKEIKLEKPTFNIVKNTNKKLVLDLVFNGSFQGKTGTVDDVYVSIKSFSPVKLHLSDNIKPYEKLEGKMTIIDDNKIRMEFNVKNEGDLYDVYNITNGKVKNSFLTSPAYIIDDDTKIESYTPIQSQYVNELVKFGNDKQNSVDLLTFLTVAQKKEYNTEIFNTVTKSLDGFKKTEEENEAYVQSIEKAVTKIYDEAFQANQEAAKKALENIAKEKNQEIANTQHATDNSKNKAKEEVAKYLTDGKHAIDSATTAENVQAHYDKSKVDILNVKVALSHTINVNKLIEGNNFVDGTGIPKDSVIIRDRDNKVLGTGIVGENKEYNIKINRSLIKGEIIKVTPKTGDDEGETIETIVQEKPYNQNEHTVELKQPKETDTTVSGTGKPGDTIIIKDKDGKELGTGTVGKDKTFNITVNRPLVVDETLTATPMTGDNQGTDGKTTVKFNPNAHTVNINPVKVGDKELTGKGTPGDTVILKNQKGETLGQVIVDKDGHYKVENPNVTLGDVITATPTIGEHQGTPTTAIVGGVDGGEAEDIGTPDSHKPTITQPTEGDTTVSGEGTPGDTIIIKDKDGKELGTGTVGQDNKFEISVNRPLVVDEPLIATPMTGDNKGTDGETTVAFDPNGHMVSINPVKVGDKELTGQGTPGDTVILKNQNGETLGQVIVDKDGHYKVKNPNVTLGDVITATPTIGDHQGTPTTAIVGGVDGGEAEDIGTPDSHKPTITQPTEGDTTVSGEGTPGDTIIIKDKDGKELGTGTVGQDNKFEISVNRPLVVDEPLIATPMTGDNQGTDGKTTVKFNPNAHTVNINPVKVGDKELTGQGTPGDTVILKNQKGETLGQVIVDKDGHYKVENPNVTLGDVITATPTIGDHQGTPTKTIVGGVDGG